MSCSFDSPEAQSRLPALVAAAPHSFLSAATPPRHAKAYRNFAAEHRRLQQERLAAFREYIADVQEGRFPERTHLLEMEAPFLDEVMRAIGAPS